jgi:hypothetical protein
LLNICLHRPFSFQYWYSGVKNKTLFSLWNGSVASRCASIDAQNLLLNQVWNRIQWIKTR